MLPPIVAKDDPGMEGLKLDYLKYKADAGWVHVIGRTSYRTAIATDVFMKCTRKSVTFLEERIEDKDNHVTIIFQLQVGPFEGTYYAFLTDDTCLIGTDILWERF